MKSLSETQPDFGVASAPVEVHLYVEGRGQFVTFWAMTAACDASKAMEADNRTHILTLLFCAKPIGIGVKEGKFDKYKVEDCRLSCFISSPKRLYGSYYPGVVLLSMDVRGTRSRIV